ncbi:transglutaminase domain-containing protein [Vibrio alginolyticus]|nr:transglutaminase domain-containing protein [Vibrio alginolyticus]
MAQTKKQKWAAAAKRKAKQAEQLAARSQKAQAELERIVAVVYEVYSEVKAQYDTAMNTTFNGNIPVTKGGICIPLATLGQAALKERGIDAKLVGGKAAFGFNMGSYGALDFGFTQNLFMPYAHEGIESFNGHAWLEFVGMDAVIDFAMPELPRLVAISNAEMGIIEHEDIELDVTKLVIKRSEMVTELVRQKPMLGYYYTKPVKSITERVHHLADLGSKFLWASQKA